MKRLKPFIISSLLGLGLLPFCSPSIQACSDFDFEIARFWLFQPNIAGTVELLPFTYTSDLFYRQSWAPDTSSYRYNAEEWQALLGPKVKTADVYTILYQTEPEDFFAGRFARNNSFLLALRQPANAVLLAYLELAKRAEAAMINPADQSTLQTVKDEAVALLKSATGPFLQTRLAFQLMKLSGYLGDRSTLEQQFAYIQSKAPQQAWVRDAALVQMAIAQPFNSAERNFWLAQAIAGSRWQKAYLVQLFQRDKLAAALALAKTNAEKAALEVAAALHYPGRALEQLQRIQQLSPGHPALDHLLAREINKLENWLLTTSLTGDQPYFDQYRVLAAAEQAQQVKKDLQYLHQVYNWVKSTLPSTPRKSKSFWQLSAAHLMLLDGDFAQARLHLTQMGDLNQVPRRLQVQARVTELLAEILAGKTIAATTAEKIPGLMILLEQSANEILDADVLQSQLALFLSDAFIKKGEIAKGVLLLSKTQRSWNSTFGNRVFYLRLLDLAKPRDYDALLALLAQKKAPTAFEKWLLARPISYEYVPWDNSDWDPVAVRMVQRWPTDSRWDLDKIKEFKARYYLWHDQLDSAYAVLKTIPNAYWQKQVPANPGILQNPFAVGIAMPDEPLSAENPGFDRNQTKFVAQLLALRRAAEQEKDPLAKQRKYLLIGNAYFNLTWMGRWWSVFHTQRSSVEFVDVRNAGFSPAAVGWQGWPGSLGLSFLALGLVLRRQRRAGQLLALLGVSTALLTCQRPVADAALAIPADFDSAYYRCDRAMAYYKKAFAAAPQNEHAIIAAYMISICERAAAVVDYQKKHPDEYLFEDELNEKLPPQPSPYLAKLPTGLRYEPAHSCNYFANFQAEFGR